MKIVFTSVRPAASTSGRASDGVPARPDTTGILTAAPGELRRSAVATLDGPPRAEYLARPGVAVATGAATDGAADPTVGGRMLKAEKVRNCSGPLSPHPPPGKTPRVTLGIPTDDRSPFDDTPSYEELSERSPHSIRSPRQQAALIADLEAEIADLEQRLGRNPRNSSMPPSAEGLSKPPAPNRAERRAAKRRPGKQPGSEGKHLAQVADPDEVVTHLPGAARVWRRLWPMPRSSASNAGRSSTCPRSVRR